MRTRSRMGSILLCGIAAAAVFLAGCRIALPQPGALALEGATRTADDIAGGFLATVDCSPEAAGQGGMRATEVGAVSHGSVPLVNSGDKEVTIYGVEILLLDSDGRPSTHQQSYFTWATRAPDLPLTLAVGGRTTFTVAFSADVGGVYMACLNINTSDGYQQVRLTGEAGWVVTLEVPPGDEGKIIAPITVSAGQQITYLCVESPMTLTAVTADGDALVELRMWQVTAGTGTTEHTTVTDKSSLSTTATIPENGSKITADFYTPYIYVGAGGNLVTAVDTYVNSNPLDGDGIKTYKGIIMQVGSYTLSGAVALPQCILRGGYTNASTRTTTYTTEAGRAAGTLIDTAGYDFTFDGSTVTSDSLIEGIQVTAGNDTSGLVAAFGVVNGADPTVRYCTFIGGGGSATNSIGLYVYNSSPAVSSCVITGSDTTATGGRSVGLWTTYDCAPTIDGCTISAGTASGSYGKSYGVFNSSYAASPIIQDCAIYGGAGSSFAAALWTGEGGRPRIEGNTLSTADAASSNYGIYIYSNGRLDTLFGNNIYGCSTALVFDYPHDQNSYTSIDDVNEDFVTGDQEVNTSAAP
jgi:hypothetical protein